MRGEKRVNLVECLDRDMLANWNGPGYVFAALGYLESVGASIPTTPTGGRGYVAPALRVLVPGGSPGAPLTVHRHPARSERESLFEMEHRCALTGAIALMAWDSTSAGGLVDFRSNSVHVVIEHSLLVGWAGTG